MNTYTVTPKAVKVEADSPEEAARLGREIFGRMDLEEFKAIRHDEVREALEFYAEPESYWAIFIVPDRPAGLFADDVGCCLLDGEHDHRHGRKARKALGDEWGGTEPCPEMLKAIANE